MKFSRQTTLRSQATVTGVGVHSGLPVNLTLGPAPVDAGFIFVRTGLDGADREVPATAESVTATEFATVLGDRKARWFPPPNTCLLHCGAWVSTTPPSKSTDPKCRSWTAAPRRSLPRSIRPASSTQSASRRFIQVLKPVQVEMGDSFGELRPHAAGFRAEVEIDFANPVIGRQSYIVRPQPRTVPSRNQPRPYLRLHERRGANSGVRVLRSAPRSRIRWCSTKPACSIPKGCATADECVRHKVLDVVGDLALAGLPLLGAYPLGAGRPQAQSRGTRRL